MSRKLPEHVSERVIELKKKDGLSNRAIQAVIAEELNENVSLGKISNLTSELLTKEIKEKMPDLPKYETREIDGQIHYVFQYRDKNTKQVKEFMPVHIDMVKGIAYDFSKHGGNLTQQEIMEKYELNWNFWTTIKSRLNLGKHSNVIDPVSLQILEEKGDDAVDEEIEVVTHRAIHDKYKKKYISTYKTAIEKNGIAALKREGTREAIISGVEDRVKEMGLPKLPTLKKHPIKKPDWTIETITDLHIGKENTFAIFDRLDAISQQIIDKPQNTVYLEFLGDLGEIFVEGGRHPGQVESMEGVYGYDLIMQVVEVITRFVYNIAKHKRVHFIGIGGNHDVFSTAKDGDQARTAALVCYAMAKERLRDQDNITFVIPRDAVYVYDIDNKIRNIIAHGEEMSKKSLPHIVMEYGDTNMYNVVKYGHLHFTHIKETSDKGLMVGCPGLAGKGSYDRRKMVSSNSGTLSIEQNPYSNRNTPKISINLQ